MDYTFSVLCLGQYALISAFDDSRFKPVKHTEISDLKCHVSLLHSFEVSSVRLLECVNAL